MTGLDAAAVVRWLVEASWQVAVLVGLVLIAQLVFGRFLTPRWRYALWLLVVVRLAIPWSPEFEAGALRWDVESFSRPFPAWIDAPIVRATKGADPATDPNAGLETARPDRDENVAVSATSSTPAISSAPAEPPIATTTPTLDAVSIAVLVWASVTALLMLRAVVREVSFRRRLRRATPIEDARTLALVEECRQIVGVRRPLTIVETDLVGSPAVYGLLRPRLLLPTGFVNELTPTELRPVLLHELFHVRRGDVRANLVLSVLSAAYWFHPLVHLAIRRLRATRETARDWDALRATPDAAAAGYARTLLKLVENRPNGTLAPAVGFTQGGRDLKRRILMIAAFERLQSRTPLATAAGAALLIALGWVTFTQAAPKTVLDPLAPPVDAAGLKEVEIERETPAPTWRSEINRRLEMKLDGISFSETPLAEVASFVSRVAQLNVIIDGSAYDFDDPLITLEANQISVRRAFDLISQMFDGELTWAVIDELVVFGARGELRETLDMRFYRLDPFLVDVPLGDQNSKVHEITDLLRDDTENWDVWDRDGVQMEYWNGLLVVVQTEAVHAASRDFLNLLLNRGERRPMPVSPWKQQILETIEKRVTVSFGDEPLIDVALALQTMHGIPIILTVDDDDAWATLELEDVPLRVVLEHFARQNGLRMSVEENGVYLGETVPPRLEIYEIGDLVAPRRSGDDVDYRDHLCELVRMNVDPESWDIDPRYSIIAWEDLLLVRQHEQGHARIESMFAAMRRALGRKD